MLLQREGSPRGLPSYLPSKARRERCVQSTADHRNPARIAPAALPPRDDSDHAHTRVPSCKGNLASPGVWTWPPSSTAYRLSLLTSRRARRIGRQHNVAFSRYRYEGAAARSQTMQLLRRMHIGSQACAPNSHAPSYSYSRFSPSRSHVVLVSRVLAIRRASALRRLREDDRLRVHSRTARAP